MSEGRLLNIRQFLTDANGEIVACVLALKDKHRVDNLFNTIGQVMGTNNNGKSPLTVREYITDENGEIVACSLDVKEAERAEKMLDFMYSVNCA